MMVPGRLFLAICALVLAAGTPLKATAQSPSPSPETGTGPSGKLLAIGTRTPKATPNALAPAMQSEVQETVRLYLSGKLEQWFIKRDRTGVVFILNVDDPAQGRELLDSLPLARAGLMEFQIIPIGPLAPLGLLLGK
jgi:hypothetical protein